MDREASRIPRRHTMKKQKTAKLDLGGQEV